MIGTDAWLSALALVLALLIIGYLVVHLAREK
jgi:hypothetical protein